MNYRNISHFAEGLVTGMGRGKASLNSLLEAENIRIHTGSAALREGQDYLDDDDYPIDADINAVYELSRVYLDVGVMKTYREYVVSAGTRLWGIPHDTEDCDELNASYLLDGDDIWAAEYMDWMYIVNGLGYNPPDNDQSASLYKYDAINFFQGYIEAPPIPTINATGGAAAGMVGYRAYKYRYIYSVLDGSGEVVDYVASPFSPVGYSPNLTGANAPVVGITSSADAQVNYIELYCTHLFAAIEDIAGQPFYRLDYDGAVVYYQGLSNAAHNYEDTDTDANLITDATNHPAEDTTISWTNPPVIGMDLLTYHKDRLYAIAVSNPSAPIYSDLGVPESWPTDNWLDCRRDDGDPVTGFCSSGNDLYIFKTRSIWILTGDPDASAILQVKTGGERTGTQTEFGLGCTASRSIATYGDDAVIFYSKIYGVYMISEGRLYNLSKNVSGILNLSDDTSGAVYTDDDGEAFYVLSPPTGNAWVFHLDSKTVVQDTNVNVSCFCINESGQLLGAVGKKLNHFYDSASDKDNGTEIQGRLKTAWVNLRNGEFEALLRAVQFQTNSAYDAISMTVFDETESERYSTSISGSDRKAGVPSVRGRLFSLLLQWTKGSIESLTLLFLRRRIH